MIVISSFSSVKPTVVTGFINEHDIVKQVMDNHIYIMARLWFDYPYMPGINDGENINQLTCLWHFEIY